MYVCVLAYKVGMWGLYVITLGKRVCSDLIMYRVQYQGCMTPTLYRVYISTCMYVECIFEDTHT